jgi:hypothetical protein
MTSSLQPLECPAKAESSVLGHSEADRYVRFLCAVSMLRNGSEGHADDAFLGEQFGEEIDVKRGYALVKNHDPISVMLNFPNGSWHRFSIPGRAS